ncbi:uncharacterized protein LOC110740188 [Chenopodium quinoa]|uniref:uncharacterized protein LOC110740188 n=1 Tax=Chenopodium quinoa TaxID=63459 RepID=UPI000B785F87|nr:uncharacterized protein LOC110740188 [Chenopodium quinoa]
MPMCKYDSRGDLNRYITSYEGNMILYTNFDVVWCKVFPTTLTGAASDWTSGELMAVEQKLDESLRDYIRRFNNEANTIPKLQQEIAVMALMSGLNNCEFKRYLIRKSLPTLAAAFNKAHDYIKGEELLKTISKTVR